MKPGVTLHPLRTGFILYKIPSKKLPFGIWKVRHLKDDIEEVVNAGAKHIEVDSNIIQFNPQFRKKFYREIPQILEQVEYYKEIKIILEKINDITQSGPQLFGKGLCQEEIVQILEQVEYFKELRNKGLTFSVHIDSIAYSFPNRFRRMRVGAISHFQYLVNYYSRLNPIYYTLHPGPSEIFSLKEFKDLPTTRDPRKMISELFKGHFAGMFKKVGFKTLAIEEILREAPRAFEGLDEAGIDLNKVYIENDEGMTRADFDELFGRLSKMFPQLGCVLDVGHLLTAEYLKNKNCVEDFVHYWGKKKRKIKAVHCHDVVITEQKIVPDQELLEKFTDALERAFIGRKEELIKILDAFENLAASLKVKNSKPHLEDHQPLGTGILNLPSLLKALKEADFQGPIIFEPGTHAHEKTVESVKILAQEIEKIKAKP